MIIISFSGNTNFQQLDGLFFKNTDYSLLSLLYER